MDFDSYSAHRNGHQARYARLCETPDTPERTRRQASEGLAINAFQPLRALWHTSTGSLP